MKLNTTVNNTKTLKVNGTDTASRKAVSNFREGKKNSIYIAFSLGFVIISSAIILGKSTIFIAIGVFFPLIVTLFWRKSDRLWINVASMAAATPVAIARYKFNCNLIFALYYALLDPRCLFRLPRWIYLPSILVIIGLMTSSINWVSDGGIRGLSREVVFAFNLFWGPFLLLPVIYLRMRESRNHEANLKSLLFFLLIPSTVLLISTKLFGTVSNWWSASQHVQMLPEGFLMYRLGNVYVHFLRTEIGFILAVLICASAAIASSPVKRQYKLIATGCLIINVFLLLSTFSVGSTAACLLGLIAIFYSQLSKISLSKVITSLFVICITLILSYVFAPSSTKEYMSKRLEHRVTNRDTDRFYLWEKGIKSIIKHPEGVGLNFRGDSGGFIHNDYITYMVSYGFVGGLGYLILVTGLIFSFLRIRKKIKDPSALAVYLAGFGALIALAANGITDHSNENRWYFNVMWSIIWYCYFCSLQNEKKKNPPVALSRRNI